MRKSHEQTFSHSSQLSASESFLGMGLRSMMNTTGGKVLPGHVLLGRRVHTCSDSPPVRTMTERLDCPILPMQLAASYFFLSTSFSQKRLDTTKSSTTGTSSKKRSYRNLKGLTLSEKVAILRSSTSRRKLSGYAKRLRRKLIEQNKQEQ